MRLLVLFPLGWILTGCSENTPLLSYFQPYQIDVQQGNYLTAEMIQELKIGMNKVEIRRLLGTPVLETHFDNPRWIYLYTERVNGLTQKTQKLALHFKADRLVQIEGDLLNNLTVALATDNAHNPGLTTLPSQDR
jgi:outer membrane protein assembly factor BamE